MKNETVFAELKVKFFHKKGVERSIAKYSSPQHILNASFLEIVRQILRF